MAGQSKRVGRIALEECIRCVALEVVIGLPPLGIVQGLGIGEQKLGLIASISLPVPILISVQLRPALPPPSNQPRFRCLCRF